MNLFKNKSDLNLSEINYISNNNFFNNFIIVYSFI